MTYIEIRSSINERLTVLHRLTESKVTTNQRFFIIYSSFFSPYRMLRRITKYAFNNNIQIFEPKINHSTFYLSEVIALLILKSAFENMTMYHSITRRYVAFSQTTSCYERSWHSCLYHVLNIAQCAQPQIHVSYNDANLPAIELPYIKSKA